MTEKNETHFIINPATFPRDKAEYLARETLRMVRAALADPVQRANLERRIRERKERERAVREEPHKEAL